MHEMRVSLHMYARVFLHPCHFIERAVRRLKDSRSCMVAVIYIVYTYIVIVSYLRRMNR